MGNLLNVVEVLHVYAVERRDVGDKSVVSENPTGRATTSTDRKPSVSLQGRPETQVWHVARGVLPFEGVIYRNYTTDPTLCSQATSGVVDEARRPHPYKTKTNPAAFKTQQEDHQKHCRTAASSSSTRVTTKQATRVSASPSTSVDIRLVQIGCVQVSQSITQNTRWPKRRHRHQQTGFLRSKVRKTGSRFALGLASFYSEIDVVVEGLLPAGEVRQIPRLPYSRYYLHALDHIRRVRPIRHSSFLRTCAPRKVGIV